MTYNRKYHNRKYLKSKGNAVDELKIHFHSNAKLRWYFTFVVFSILASTLILLFVLTFVLSNTNIINLSRLGLLPLLVGMFLFSMFVGTCITFILANNVLKPINNLSNAMSRVASGDFKVKLDENSKFTFVQNINKDFNNMVAELGTVDTLRNDFISNVSHEFKTPLGSIEGYAMLLQDCSLGDEQKTEYIERIIFNSRRLSTLVGNILMLSKVENRTIPMPRTKYRIDEQIRQSILTFEPKWSQKNIEFEMNMENTEFTAIEPLMNHVFLNLIDNAVKFSPENATVYIDLSESESCLTFRIANLGEQLSKATMTHLFEKFYQGDTSHRSEGNGLGLALVSKIVTLHKGNIKVDNTTNGLIEFIVKLPKS